MTNQYWTAEFANLELAPRLPLETISALVADGLAILIVEAIEEGKK